MNISFDEQILLKRQLQNCLTEEERQEVLMKIKQQKEEKENQPYIQFNNVVRYHTTCTEIRKICDELIVKAEMNFCNQPLVIGFDMEWKYDKQKNESGKVAVIQMCISEDITHIFHVVKFKTLPKSLKLLLLHPRVKLTGVCVKSDIRKLSKDFRGFNVHKIMENCIDSAILANKVLGTNEIYSMEKLVNGILKMKVDKNPEVRCSDWSKVPLKPEQRNYAATDAYASLLIYKKLKEMEAKAQN